MTGEPIRGMLETMAEPPTPSRVPRPRMRRMGERPCSFCADVAPVVGVLAVPCVICERCAIAIATVHRMGHV